ncbi:MAG: endonuclease/exonuclease/phosphatase family protein [Deltaproteobacteria bacterium]|nr:endonuclease/exonuclease/phosphatase family protein [Deltaproteobacteria bacterium]
MRFLPLLALLLLAVVLSPSARAEPGRAARQLRVMTYNLNYGNPSPRASLDAIEAADVDIVLLQEITSEWRDSLKQRFAKQYPHQAYRVIGHGSGGIAALSKHPITSEELWAAPPRTGAWFPAQRLVIDGPLGPLQILNVHLRPCLDGGSWVRGFLTTPPIRRKEIEAHWKKLDYQLPTIVAGDFNEDATGRAIEYLMAHGMTRVPTTGPTTWHYETHTRGQAHDLLKMDIDHVMIDSHFVAEDAHVVDAGASDHRPVIVTIRPK